MISARVVKTLVAAAAVMTVAFYLWPKPEAARPFDTISPESIPDLHDAQIIEEWMPGHRLVDAVDFFADGGMFASTEVEPDLDQELLLPLLRVLRDECKVDPVVLLDDPEIAFAVVIDVHAADTDRSAIIDAIERVNEDYPGLIVGKWGRTWLSIDLLDQQKAAMLEESGRLKQLRESISAEHALVRSGGTH